MAVLQPEGVSMRIILQTGIQHHVLMSTVQVLASRGAEVAKWEASSRTLVTKGTEPSPDWVLTLPGVERIGR